MNIIKQFPQIILIAIFLSSCMKSINKDEKLEKKRMEINFSCGEEGISEYLNDGWVILREDTKEKICTWKSVAATKDCDMEKDKGCKITKPDKIGKEKTYLLEK